jgi:hypothetical protein
VHSVDHPSGEIRGRLPGFFPGFRPGPDKDHDDGGHQH